MSTHIVAKNEPISNIDIEKLCKRYYIPLNGCVMNDELIDLQVGNYIINLNNLDQSGSHWCALVVNKDMAVYFDSFGAPPNQYIHDLIRQYFPRVYFNNFIIQNLNSEACGYYCIGLLLYLKKHHNEPTTLMQKFDGYCNLFFDDTRKNFAVLKQFLKTNS